MAKLPWSGEQPVLMLAPMQGLTNRAMRASLIARSAPDLVFTEFVRVQANSRKRIPRADLADIRSYSGCVPLVVQLIGHGAEALADAAVIVQDAGADHLNLNLGCPYGRMTSGATGGVLLREPAKLAKLLQALRAAVRGSFSVKSRAGYDDPRQIFQLLPVYEEAGVDFLILHPRTVEQHYRGCADHDITAEVAARTDLPLIANGDINTAAQGRRILAAGGVAGLMLGRGALADPLLFRRLRGELPEAVPDGLRRQEVYAFLDDLLPRYQELFCGDRQVLMKIKDVLNFIPDEDLQRDLGRMKRAKEVADFRREMLKLREG